ncbi:hypothetical protein C8Q74DRAFT_1205439 [Fomes fomentarius]|nr:hypothetical protein C8Q74DRAFT_1205439 [Fomes fomentarius]
MGTPKVLIANRGEKLGWFTVALYTETDSSHASYADEAIPLDSPARYMDPEHIADIARRAGCTHVHPGYGFLGESSKFASLFTHASSVSSSDTAGIIFVGPSVETLNIASDKMLSRDLAVSLGVPVAPGSSVASVTDIRQFIATSGCNAFPIVLKALDGGGGRGIRLVNQLDQIEDAYERCLGESPSRRIFAEKALVGPDWKHIEVQIVGDGHGNVTHLWERECSVQRRFQKIVEMAPSTLGPTMVRPLLEAAVKMARHLQYAGLGTFEFLFNSRSHEWVFLEINPRIQVEHTVTEEVVDIDLVRVQLSLSIPGTTLEDVIPRQPAPQGHAIQLRLIAEDHSFRLSPGTVKPSHISWPAGKGVRVDTWLCAGPYSDPDVDWTVGVNFDSLLAKIIVRGANLAEATAKAKRAARETRLSGEVKTNAELLAGVVAHDDWQQGSIHTRWLEEHLEEVLELGKEALRTRRTHPLSQSSSPSEDARVSANAPQGSGSILLQPGSSFQLSITPSQSSSTSTTDSRGATQNHSLVLSSIGHNAFPHQLSGTLATSLSSNPLAFSLTQLSSMTTSQAFEFANPQDATHLSCPLAGKIVDLHPALTNLDAYIRKGEPLVVVSVMKMESVVTAPRSGKVGRVGRGIEIGAVIPEGVLVCVLDVEGSQRARL